jgi:hypothetical protein
MTAPLSQPDPLGAALHQTESELSEKLAEACMPAPQDVSDESTAELAKLSDSLLAAARAAKDVVTLRTRRRERSRASREVPAGETIREFVDTDGREWRVWPVTPNQHRVGKRESSLGEFEHGWLAFETLDEEARRRLPNYPVDWMDMPEASLQELLRRAVEAPTRRAESRRAESSQDSEA